MDLLTEKPAVLLRHYLLPSVSATLVTSAYIIVDTMMVGRGCGADALVALNLVLPIFSALFALGMLFGVGGGVLYSVARGAQDEKRAAALFSTAFTVNLLLSIVALVLGSVFLRPLGYLLGADDTNIVQVMEYGAYVVHFAPAFMFSTFLQAFVRNDNAPKHAMIGVLSGAVTNIVLDYIFIFQLGMGLSGGAAATVLGNIVTVTILFTHMASKKCGLRLQRQAVAFSLLPKIAASGAPSALIELAAGVVTFSFNRQILRYLGNTAIVVYGIIANCALVCMSLFNGVSQACQPIMAANFGAAQMERVLHIRKLGYRIILGLGVFLASTAYWMPDILISMFVEPTAAIVQMGHPVLRLYFLAFIPMGCNLFFSTFFQSIVKPVPSLTLSLLRGVILPLSLVLLLPACLGGQAIWTVVPLTELLTLLTAIGLLYVSAKNSSQIVNLRKITPKQ